MARSFEQHQPITVTDNETQALQNADAQRKQLFALTTALQKAIEPLVMRMDEKLRVDMSTDETGKLIVSNLRRLNEILQE